MVSEYCFMGTEGAETIAIQMALDRISRVHFANVVPRKGMTHEYGADVMIDDLEKLGQTDIILKCDREPALNSVQEEVTRRRTEKTILENSLVEYSKANRAASEQFKQFKDR